MRRQLMRPLFERGQRWLLLIAAALMPSAMFGANVVHQVGELKQNFDGSYDEAYKNGDKPPFITSTSKKWHPGYFLSIDRNNQTLDTQSLRFANYDADGSNTKLTGFSVELKWSLLEGSTAGNYTAGDAMILAEIAHLKNEPHPMRMVFKIPDVADSSYCGSSTCQQNFFPAYLQSTCLAQDNIAGQGLKTHFKWWLSTCVGYYNALITHLGALLDSEPYVEAVGLNYEEAMSSSIINGGEFTLATYNAGVSSAVTNAAAAFPHTNLFWNTNYGVNGTDAALLTILGYLKAAGVGTGDQDACPLDPVTGQYQLTEHMPVYINGNDLFRGYGFVGGVWTSGQYTDQRDKMFTIFGVEASELGYNAVCGSPGMTGKAWTDNTYGSLYNWWNDTIHSTHAIIERNTYIGISAQRWTYATGDKSLYDMVQTPLTHTNCPTDYDTKFGNGSAGSGCNTN